MHAANFGCVFLRVLECGLEEQSEKEDDCILIRMAKLSAVDSILCSWQLVGSQTANH